MVRGSPNPRHFGLPARLRKARRQVGLARAALGPKVGLDPAVAAYIESGQRIPTVGTVSRLASGLGISAGWLAYGLGDQHSDEQGAAVADMGTRLRRVREEKGITKAALARLADLSPPALANIEKGAQTGVDVLDTLAKTLGVSPAWLAYGEGPQVLPARRRVRIAAATTHAAELG